MRKTLTTVFIAAGILAGVAGTASAVTVNIPGAGKPNCAGVTSGKVNAGTGGVSYSGLTLYFSSLGNCLH